MIPAYEQARRDRNVKMYGSQEEPTVNKAIIRTNMIMYGSPTAPTIKPPQTELDKELDAVLKWADEIVGELTGIHTCLNLYTYKKHIADDINCHCDICMRSW